MKRLATFAWVKISGTSSRFQQRFKRFLSISKFKFFLIYGENEGQKIDVIQSNFNEFTKENTFKYNEKEVIENKQLLFESIYSKSFFESEKLILISEVTDKIFDLIDQIISDNVSDVKIFLIINGIIS